MSNITKSLFEGISLFFQVTTVIVVVIAITFTWGKPDMWDAIIYNTAPDFVHMIPKAECADTVKTALDTLK